MHKLFVTLLVLILPFASDPLKFAVLDLCESLSLSPLSSSVVRKIAIYSFDTILILGFVRFYHLRFQMYPKAGGNLKHFPVFIFVILGSVIVPPLVNSYIDFSSLAETSNGTLPYEAYERIVPDSSSQGLLIADFAAIVFLGPILEELTYRGVLFSLLDKNLGRKPAVFLSSVSFALMHLPMRWWFSRSYELEYTVEYFISGLILCLIFLRYGNILAPILAHMANNAFMFGIRTVGIENTIPWVKDGSPLWGQALILLLFVLSVTVFAYEIVYKTIRNEILTTRTSGPDEDPALARRAS
jgi:membrane protease YdiL (CAAX protease family)